MAETYFVEPPNWERTDNWRPPASPGNNFYWHDRSWAPECPWDIGRLTKKSLTAPACTWTFGCSIPGCANQCVANMFQRIEDDYQPKSVYHVTSVPDGAPLPLYEMPPRFPIGRSAFAVDAYRCPLLAAIVLKLARASNVSLISSQGLEAPGVACPTYEDIDLIAPILNNYTASLKPIPEPFKSPVDSAIWPFTYKPSYSATVQGTPWFGALSFAGNAEQAKDIIGRYCKSEVVAQDLQEVIYNVLPEYQEALLYNNVTGPDGQPKTVCRDKEGILDDVPKSVQLPVIQELYNSNLRTIEASQCYGHLSQYLDPSQIPWQDRLVRAGESLPAWEPVAGAWRALHDKCRSITVEDTCKDAVFPELQGNVVSTMLQYQTSVANDSTWNDPYNTTFTRPAPPLPPPPEQELVEVDASEAEAPVGSYDDNFLTGGLQFDGATGDQQPLHSATERRYASTLPFTAAIAAAVLLI